MADPIPLQSAIGGDEMKPVLGLLRILAGCLAVAFAVTPALAQQGDAATPKAVVELFTSQGCSSCPPADALFVDLARDPSLIVLTMPVDYWDYLGWKDTLAHSAFTARQRFYAQTRGDNTVYTPQAIVNGGMHAVGSDRGKIEMMTVKSSLPVAVTVAGTGEGDVQVSVGPGVMPRDTSKEPLRGSVYLLPVLRSTSVAIVRGENRGKLVSYANVVRGIHRLGEWTGEATRFDVSAAQHKAWVSDANATGFVVLLQAENRKNGKILGAARSKTLELPAI
jgi:hypothetical protein